MRPWIGPLLALGLGIPPAAADDPPPARPPVAPVDARIFSSDLAGAYFIARPLREEYDALRGKVAALRAEIREARVDSATALGKVAALQVELGQLLARIDATKRYIPGARVEARAGTATLPLAPGDSLLVDAEAVEIIGWDRPEVECTLEKTVLDADGAGFAADLAGIKLVFARASGKDPGRLAFGLLAPPDAANHWDQPPLKDIRDEEFIYVTVRGLVHGEGNRQIELRMASEAGESQLSFKWRRHARLVLHVPRCRRIAARGALGRFRAVDLAADLAVAGSGNRDYSATYEVANLRGNLAAEGIPIHRITGVAGDVTVINADYGHERRDPPPETTYRDLRGDLRVRFCRADLTVEGVTGRVSIDNDFGSTTWLVDAAVPADRDHRVVSQGGAVALRFGPGVRDDLAVNLLTECGTIRATREGDRFATLMFSTTWKDAVRRSWFAEVRLRGQATRLGPAEQFDLYSRPADAVNDRPRIPDWTRSAARGRSP